MIAEETREEARQIDALLDTRRALEFEEEVAWEGGSRARLKTNLYDELKGYGTLTPESLNELMNDAVPEFAKWGILEVEQNAALDWLQVSYEVWLAEESAHAHKDLKAERTAASYEPSQTMVLQKVIRESYYFDDEGVEHNRYLDWQSQLAAAKRLAAKCRVYATAWKIRCEMLRSMGTNLRSQYENAEGIRTHG